MVFDKKLCLAFSFGVILIASLFWAFQVFLEWERIPFLWENFLTKLENDFPFIIEVLLPTVLYVIVFWFIFLVSAANYVGYSEYSIAILISLAFSFVLFLSYLFGWFDIFSLETAQQFKLLVVFLFIYDALFCFPPSRDSTEDFLDNSINCLPSRIATTFVFVWLFICFGLGEDSASRYWIGFGICLINIIVAVLFYFLVAMIENLLHKIKKTEADEV